jgi:SAM-dependent methyltransferase
MTAQPDRSRAVEFEDADVVAAYVHRPDYPPALHARLVELMPARGAVLDLGCGPGKLARALAPQVALVRAVDPSAAMLDLGRALDAGAHRNIAWTQAFAEDLDLADASLDLAVAGASIHWMDPAVVFPKLARALVPGAPLAIVDGDGPSEAPWLDDYRGVIQGWVARVGGVWNGPAHQALMHAHDPWLDVQGEETFTAEVRQSVENLIACEHSRATFSRAAMGALAEPFDADLRAVLEPGAEDGVVSYAVRSRLVWGWPRAAAALKAHTCRV